MIDASHANSSKQHQRRSRWRATSGAQLAAGNRCIFGVMVESHLHAGAQKFTPGKDDPPNWSTARASPTPASAGTTP
jgi:3-deoxy-7-phosphoheptulonate synthase